MTERRHDGPDARLRRWTRLVGILGVLGVAGSWRLSAQDSIPIGYGSLRRDDIVVRLTTSQVEVQVLPLAERVIRLLAPDTYRSLRSLLQSRDTLIRDAASRAGTDTFALVMVTFLGVVPQARFNPEDVNITSRGRLFRPVSIVPITPAWGTNQLDARQQAAAIYLFEPGIGLSEQLTVSYEGRQSDSWTHSIRVLERERALVQARAQQAPPPDSTRPPP